MFFHPHRDIWWLRVSKAADRSSTMYVCVYIFYSYSYSYSYCCRLIRTTNLLMYYSFAFKTKMSSHVVSCLLCIILYIVNNALPLDTCAGVCVCVCVVCRNDCVSQSWAHQLPALLVWCFIRVCVWAGKVKEPGMTFQRPSHLTLSPVKDTCGGSLGEMWPSRPGAI